VVVVKTPSSEVMTGVGVAMEEVVMVVAAVVAETEAVVAVVAVC
jgi:hypothetical protein